MLTLARRLFDMVRRKTSAARSRRRQVLSARMLDSLPASLRRDIGWPDRYIGVAADGGWGTPIDVAGPLVKGPFNARARPARAVGTASVPASRRPVHARLSLVRKPPVSS
jgi:hypothetical protein